MTAVIEIARLATPSSPDPATPMALERSAA